MLKYFYLFTFLLITNTALAQEDLSEMTLIETNHGYLTAAVITLSKNVPIRIILGQNADYQRIGYKYEKEAFKDAELEYSKGHTSAAIKIKKIKSLSKKFTIVLKNPVSKELYAYNIKANAQGHFSSPIINLEKPRFKSPLPRLKVLKTTQARNDFPRIPQPSLENYAPQETKSSIKPIANKMVSLHQKKWLEFAMMATQHLKNNNISYLNNGIFLTIKYPAKILSSQTHSGFQLASTNQNNHKGYFNWTTTNKFTVPKDDMAITEIIREIKLDPTISIDAAIAAIWTANKKSFANENIYTLMKGATLNIPPRFLAMKFQNSPNKLKQAIQKSTGIYESF